MVESHQGVLYCLLTPTRQLPAPSAGRAEAERAGGPGGTWPRGDGPGAPSRSRSCPTSTHTNKREAGQSPRGGAGLPGAACRFLPFSSSPRPPLPPTGSSDAPGRVCLSFIFASTVPSPPWPTPSSHKPRTLRPAPPPGAESPPYEAESPGVWPAPPPSLSHSPRHPGRLFAEVKLVDSRDLGEARALGVSKPFL